jgi:hypothetical protein
MNEQSNHDLIRWYWSEGPGKAELLTWQPGQPPLVVSGAKLRATRRQAGMLTPAQWQAFKEAAFKSTITPSERHAMTRQKLSRVEVVRQQLQALQAEMAFLARFPEDNFPEHTVLMTWKTFTKELPVPGQVVWVTEKKDFTYTYVLLKANGQWWMTGQNGHQINGASWDKVIEFVNEDDVIDVRTGLSIMTDAPQAKPVKYDDSVSMTEPRDPVAEVAAKADTPKAYLPQLTHVKPTYDDKS